MFQSGPVFLCVQNLDKVGQNKMVAPLEVAYTAYDELIISEMSVVMMIGHLQEAAQFTMTEILTFLVTPSFLLLWEQVSGEQSQQYYMLIQIIPALFCTYTSTYNMHTDLHKGGQRAVILLQM